MCLCVHFGHWIGNKGGHSLFIRSLRCQQCFSPQLNQTVIWPSMPATDMKISMRMFFLCWLVSVWTCNIFNIQHNFCCADFMWRIFSPHMDASTWLPYIKMLQCNAPLKKLNSFTIYCVTSALHSVIFTQCSSWPPPCTCWISLCFDYVSISPIYYLFYAFAFPLYNCVQECETLEKHCVPAIRPLCL